MLLDSDRLGGKCGGGVACGHVNSHRPVGSVRETRFGPARRAAAIGPRRQPRQRGSSIRCEPCKTAHRFGRQPQGCDRAGNQPSRPAGRPRAGRCHRQGPRQWPRGAMRLCASRARLMRGGSRKPVNCGPMLRIPSARPTRGGRLTPSAEPDSAGRDAAASGAAAPRPARGFPPTPRTPIASHYMVASSSSRHARRRRSPRPDSGPAWQPRRPLECGLGRQARGVRIAESPNRVAEALD